VTTFAPASLPLNQKEDLCRGLLAEFGITVTRSTDKHELIHACRLPWHNEKTPSASLNYEKLAFRCLGCDSKGGLLWFISTMRGNSSTREVTDWLESTTGLGGYEFDTQAVLDFIESCLNPRVHERAPMPQFSPRVLEPWNLVHPYLTEDRGIPAQNIDSLRVGYDMAQDKIIIPHFWRDNLVGWQARKLPGSEGPKYKSTVDFPRETTLYNHPGGRGPIVVVESPMSTLRHAHHQPLVATFGAAVTDEQVKIISRHDDVVLWPDPDEAGWISVMGRTEGTGRRKVHTPGLIERLEAYTQVRVVDSPWFADPADLDDDTVDSLVSAAVPGSVYTPPSGTLRCWHCREVHTGPCQERG
jgi:hypothetical protein